MIDDEELREAVVMADSLLSLVAYRYPRGNIPEDVLHDMKRTSAKLRDSMAYGMGFDK